MNSKYWKLQPKLVLTLVLFWGGGGIWHKFGIQFPKVQIHYLHHSSTSLTVHAVTFSSQGSFPSAKYRFAHLFFINICLCFFPYRTFFHFFSKKKNFFVFLLFFKYLVVVLFCRSVTWFVIFKGPSSTEGISIFMLYVFHLMIC